MNEKEVWERLTSAEASVQSAHKRIDSMEKLTQSVSDMVIEVKHMREDLNRMQTELENVKNRPARFYEKLLWSVIGAAASSLAALVLSYIF